MRPRILPSVDLRALEQVQGGYVDGLFTRDSPRIDLEPIKEGFRKVGNHVADWRKGMKRQVHNVMGDMARHMRQPVSAVPVPRHRWDPR